MLKCYLDELRVSKSEPINDTVACCLIMRFMI
jgi:hypothetical protein